MVHQAIFIPDLFPQLAKKSICEMVGVQARMCGPEMTSNGIKAIKYSLDDLIFLSFKLFE